MAAEVEQAVGFVPTLIEGDAGVFDVVVDGKLLFSKHEIGRFPEPGEILEMIQA